jgi:hypothetical protein
MYLFWSDINPALRTVRVTVKPELGFYPKRWEERQIPTPAELLTELQRHTRRPNCQFVFPSPTGNREQHMLDRCEAVAKRAGLDPVKFDLQTFRSMYATLCSDKASTLAQCSIGWRTSRSKPHALPGSQYRFAGRRLPVSSALFRQRRDLHLIQFAVQLQLEEGGLHDRLRPNRQMP